MVKRPKRTPIPRVIRDAVLMRDGFTCQICFRIVSPNDLHIDHVIPVFRDGPTEPWNLRVTHARCNLLRDHQEFHAHWDYNPMALDRWAYDSEWPEHGYAVSDAEPSDDLADIIGLYDVADLPPFAPDDSHERACFVCEVLG